MIYISRRAGVSFGDSQHKKNVCVKLYLYNKSIAYHQIICWPENI